MSRACQDPNGTKYCQLNHPNSNPITCTCTCTSTSTNSFAHQIMRETRIFLLVMAIIWNINLQILTCYTPKVTQICMLLHFGAPKSTKNRLKHAHLSNLQSFVHVYMLCTNTFAHQKLHKYACFCKLVHTVGALVLVLFCIYFECVWIWTCFWTSQVLDLYKHLAKHVSFS